jgi:hypothetical protein
MGGLVNRTSIPIDFIAIPRLRSRPRGKSYLIVVLYSPTDHAVFSSSHRSRPVATLLLGFLTAGLAACTPTTSPPRAPAAAGTFTVDARTGFVYVSLKDSTTLVPAAGATSRRCGTSRSSPPTSRSTAGSGTGRSHGLLRLPEQRDEPIHRAWLAQTAESEKADFDT